jgi:hypothetical protein
VEENIGKVVGRRRRPKPTEVLLSASKLSARPSISSGKKGVFRFETFEDADKWMMDLAVAQAIKVNAPTKR